MINYYTIPDSYANFELNLKLLNLIENHPELFREDFKIASAYGCPGNCIWNGNRAGKGNYKLEEIELTFATYQSRGLSYNLTFSNTLLTEEHLSDTLGNTLARIGEIEGNKVIVTSPVFEEYIREKYPKYGIIKSIVTFFNNPSLISVDKVNEWSENNTVVLPLKYNNDFDTLAKLKYPENIEVLVNQPCEYRCPYTMDHYNAYNRSNLYLPVEPWELECRFANKNPEPHRMQKHFVSYELIKKYNDLGIHHFKIAGRDIPDLSLSEYVYRFAKPSYEDIITNLLVHINPYDIRWGDLTGALHEASFREHPKKIIEIKE